MLTSFQQAAFDHLISKALRAVEKIFYKSIMVSVAWQINKKKRTHIPFFGKKGHGMGTNIKSLNNWIGN